jgi:hypothetical protein
MSKTALLTIMGILFTIAGCSDHSKQADPTTEATGKQPTAPATEVAPTPSPVPVPTAVSTVATPPQPESVPVVDLTERNKGWHFTAWIGQICSGVGPRVYLHIVTQESTMKMTNGTLQELPNPYLQVVGVYDPDGEIRVGQDKNGGVFSWADSPDSPWHHITGEYDTKDPYSAVFFPQIGNRSIGMYVLTLTKKGKAKYLSGTFQDTELGGFGIFPPETRVVFTPIDLLDEHLSVPNAVRKVASHSNACGQVK